MDIRRSYVPIASDDNVDYSSLNRKAAESARYENGEPSAGVKDNCLLRRWGFFIEIEIIRTPKVDKSRNSTDSKINRPPDTFLPKLFHA